PTDPVEPTEPSEPGGSTTPAPVKPVDAGAGELAKTGSSAAVALPLIGGLSLLGMALVVGSRHRKSVWS
ncbi:MAG: LPXTG cell wall anchor domain-containing protein, partial [Actinomycetaceae bacterium]|nr:LPXTG cell wall anchor domain-containing protein [Actinomycetaceae bacterium]